MREAAATVVPVVVLAAVLAYALFRDRRRRPQPAVLVVKIQADTTAFTEAMNNAASAVDRLQRRVATVDGPSELGTILASRFDLDPQLAAEIANTAVWHFESPLAEALTDPKHRHPWAARS